MSEQTFEEPFRKGNISYLSSLNINGKQINALVGMENSFQECENVKSELKLKEKGVFDNQPTYIINKLDIYDASRLDIRYFSFSRNSIY